MGYLELSKLSLRFCMFKLENMTRSEYFEMSPYRSMPLKHSEASMIHFSTIQLPIPRIWYRSSCLTPETPLPCKILYSSSAGISSSMYRIRDILISVESFPFKMSLMKCASTCICTISRAPLKIPQNIFEYQSSSWALPSSGNSTKSASGFSSNIKENCLLSVVQLAIVGVMLRNILNPTSNSQTLNLPN